MDPRWRVARITVLAAGLWATLTPNARADRLYWSEAGSLIVRGDLDGGRAEVAVETLDGGWHLTVDAIAGKIYWSGSDQYAFRLRWANLDGSDVENLVFELGPFGGIAVDHATGKLYFAQTSDCPCSAIRRTDLDGTNGVSLVFPDFPGGFVADFARGRMYWGDTSTRQVWSADLEGADDRPVVSNVLPFDLALDPRAGKLYWTDGNGNVIRRANVSGSEVQTLVALETRPRGIAVDPVHGKIYWAERDSGKIRRADLDGSDVEDVLSGLDRPTAVALEFDEKGVRVTMDAGSLAFTAPVDGLRYDVLSGSLTALRRSRGNFSVAIDACVLDDGTSPLSLDSLPGLDASSWFLVRAVTATGDGTWESLGYEQVAPRDAAVAASGFDCPRTP